MAKPLITRFDLDEERLNVIRECTDAYGIGEPEHEWPNNVLSQQTVVYGSGLIARRGDAVKHAVDPDELALCLRLAAEAAETMAGTDVGMLSEASVPFHGFFIAGTVGETQPTEIDEAFIRARFGGTIFPYSTVTVEPLAEAGNWWSDVSADGAGSGDEYFVPWRRMIAWFQSRPEFVQTVFVKIGDFPDVKFDGLPEDQWPPGTEMSGSVLPRMALGLTRGGSLIGLFGHAVQT